MASFVTAAVTNHLNSTYHQSLTLAPNLDEMDRIALMHAQQAQAHAEAARHALELSKRKKETDAMPNWLEIFEETASSVKSFRRPRSKSHLNPNATPFIPSAQIAAAGPPGLTA